MYIDATGKRCNRNVKGASGRTYGNPKLLTLAEHADMLADGIEIYTPPERPSPTTEQLERRRVRSIRAVATGRIDYDLIGTGEEGDNAMLNTLLDIIEVQVDLFRDLKTKGLMTNQDFNQRVIDMKDRLVKYRSVKQAARAAIQDGDDLETAKAAIDAIIPDPFTEAP